MTRHWIRAFAIVLSMALAGCIAGEASNGDDPSEDRGEQAMMAIPQFAQKRLCDEPAEGFLACHARVRVDAYGAATVNATPQGLAPADLQSAYKVDSTLGAGKTIGIVDAMDDPTAEADLAVYRSQFGLPACTTANGCFRKVNQSGAASPLPTADSGWSGEIALDLEMASAICPKCNILLIEASSATTANLGAGVNTAVKQGATVVSNSYGGGESSSDSSYDTSYYNHPGVAIFASSGDGGYGVEYPAASPDVIAVGGTSLVKSSTTRGWTESVWGSTNNKNGGAGSGCSKYSTKPSWQKDTGCTKRTVADVSAVADPNTGVAVYEAGSWQVYGGTSAASPIVASVWALTGHGADATPGAYPYANPSHFYDVTTGANGSCGGTYLCTAVAGYDGPSGVGTPDAATMVGTGGTGGSGGGGGGGTGGAGGGGGGGTGGAGGGGGGGTGGVGGGGGGTSTCSHSICTTGKKLTSSCDACATKICSEDSYCCATRWDSICVGEVQSICGESCQ